MKHNGLEIKISDLLNGKVTDTLDFDHIVLSELEDLSEEGVSWSITLQSLDHDSIFVTIDTMECTLQKTCDRCGKAFARTVTIEDYVAKYVTSYDAEGKDTEEEILLIDTKNGIIDLEDLFYHAIKLQEPFVELCPECNIDG